MRLAIAVCASAGLLWLAFPPHGPGVVAWVGLVPLLLAARTSSVAAAFAAGVAWNLLLAFGVVDALPAGVSAHFGQPAWLGWGFSALVFTVNSCLHYGVALALYGLLARRFRAALPLLAGAAFAAAELLRARGVPVPPLVPTPVGMLSATQPGADALLQLAAWTGPYGITFLVVSVNAAIVEAIAALRDSGARRAAAVGAACTAGLLAAAWLYGVRAIPASEPGGVPVLVVQGNLDPAGAWEPESQGRNLDTYLQLTLSSFELAKPALVFWPEGAFTFLVEDAPAYRTLIARVLSAAGAELLAGGPHAGDGTPPRAFNSTWLLAPSGETRARYDKQRLLPFAEYAPFEGVDLQVRGFGPFRYWTPGGSSAPLPTRVGLAGVLVCNEVLLPQLAAERVRAGAAYLVTPANDGWLSASWIPGSPGHRWGRLMLDAARLRAIETRRWLVRASTSGPSAVIDPWGRVRAVTEPATRSVLLGAIRARSDVTPYGRLGDVFGLVCAAVALAGLVRRSRDPGYTGTR